MLRTYPAFYVGARNLNIGFQDYAASSLFDETNDFSLLDLLNSDNLDRYGCSQI